MRIITLSLLNLLLPFLIRWLWLLFIDWQQRQPVEKRMIDITPRKRYPLRLLLMCGIGLLALSLLVWRFTDTNVEPTTSWKPANPAQSRINE